MIWLFKIDEVFHGNKPVVNEHYLFDTTDISFDINKYDISLYFALAEYFILSESDDEKIYLLRYDGSNINPTRLMVPSDTIYYTVIREFYISKTRDYKLKEIGI